MGTVRQHLLNVCDERRNRSGVADGASLTSISLSSRFPLTGLTRCQSPASDFQDGSLGRWFLFPEPPGRFLPFSSGGSVLSPGFAALTPRSLDEPDPVRRQSLPREALETARRFASRPFAGRFMLVLPCPRSTVPRRRRGPLFQQASCAPAGRRTPWSRRYLLVSGHPPTSGVPPVVAFSIRPCPRVLSSCTLESVQSSHSGRGLFLADPPLDVLRPRLTWGRAGTRCPARPPFFASRRRPGDVIPILETPRSSAP